MKTLVYIILRNPDFHWCVAQVPRAEPDSGFIPLKLSSDLRTQIILDQSLPAPLPGELFMAFLLAIWKS